MNCQFGAVLMGFEADVIGGTIDPCCVYKSGHSTADRTDDRTTDRTDDRTTDHDVVSDVSAASSGSSRKLSSPTIA